MTATLSDNLHLEGNSVIAVESDRLLQLASPLVFARHSTTNLRMRIVLNISRRMKMEKKPYKIVDRSGRNKCGIVASSLGELIVKAQEKFGIPCPVKVHLQCDGTLVDEENYFSTREPDTCFQILREDESWLPSAENTAPRGVEKVVAANYDQSQEDVRLPMNKQINVDSNQPPSESTQKTVEELNEKIKSVESRVCVLENTVNYINSRQIIRSKMRSMNTNLREIGRVDAVLARQISKHLIKCNEFAHPATTQLSEG